MHELSFSVFFTLSVHAYCTIKMSTNKEQCEITLLLSEWIDLMNLFMDVLLSSTGTISSLSTPNWKRVCNPPVQRWNLKTPDSFNEVSDELIISDKLDCQIVSRQLGSKTLAPLRFRPAQLQKYLHWGAYETNQVLLSLRLYHFYSVIQILHLSPENSWYPGTVQLSFLVFYNFLVSRIERNLFVLHFSLHRSYNFSYWAFGRFLVWEGEHCLHRLPPRDLQSSHFFNLRGQCKPGIPCPLHRLPNS